MSLIGLFGSVAPSGSVYTSTTIEGDLDLSATMTSQKVYSELVLIGEPEVLIETGSEFDLWTIIEADARLNDEPNILPSATVLTSSSLSGNLTARRIASVQVIGSTRVTTGGSQSYNRTDAIRINATIFPPNSPTSFVNQTARLSIDGVAVGIKSFNFDAPANQAGSRLEVVLADPTTVVSNGSTIKFELGERATPTGSITWKTLLDTGSPVSSRGFSIGFANNAPTDSLSVSSLEALADRLAISPRRNLILYDPDKTSVNLGTGDALLDDQGNEIETITRSTVNLTLYDALNEALVVGAGFSAYKTNIANYPISRVDFSIDSSFYDSIRGLVGMFEPVVFEKDGELWILDTSQALPANFTPKSFTVSDFKSFSARSRETAPIDGLILNFIDNSFDYYTTRELPLEIETSGVFGSADYLETQILRRVREYRNFDNPAIILKTEPVSENRRIIDSLGVTIAETDETLTFDSQGKQTSIVKTVRDRVPQLNGSATPLLLLTREETTRITYRLDPASPSRYNPETIETVVSALIAVDSANPYFDAPFEQEYIEAFRSGNLSAEMSTRFGRVKTISDRFRSLKNGQTIRQTTEVDHLRNVSSVNETETGSGDLSLNGRTQKSRQMVLWKSGADIDAETGARLEQFQSGELPSRQAIALARRFLKRLTGEVSDLSGSVDFIGYDQRARRGEIVRIKNRLGSSIADFITLGFSVSGADLGTPTQAITTTRSLREVLASELGDDTIEAVDVELDADAETTFRISRLATIGKVLKVSGSVADVEILGKHVDDVSFVDLEASSIDLSPWNGSIADFDIKIVAGSISAPVSVSFEIIVE